jgi:hypothetical protein
MRPIKVVSSPEDWRDFLYRKIFHVRPWFHSDQAFGRAAAVYRALERHVTWRPPHGYGRAGRFIPCIQEAFRELRATLFDNLLPCLHVRHWMSREELARARQGELTERRGGPPPPWRAAVQPAKDYLRLMEARRAGEPFSLEAKTVIFERGNVLTRNTEVRDAWSRATVRFFLRLIQMVPAWHLSILKKSETMVGRSER